MHADGAFNLVTKSAGGINMNAVGGGINATALGSIDINSKSGSINELAAQNINLQSKQATHINAGTDRYDTAGSGTWNRKAASAIHDQAGSASISMADGLMELYGPTINTSVPMNQGAAKRTSFAPPAGTAEAASIPKTYQLSDYQTSGVQVATTRMPYHEPWPYHGYGAPGARADVSTGGSTSISGNIPSNSAGTSALLQNIPAPTENYPGVPNSAYPDYQIWLYQGTDESGKITYKKSDQSIEKLFAESYTSVSDGFLTNVLKPMESAQPWVYDDPGNHKPDVGYGHQLLSDEVAGGYVTIGGTRFPVGSKASGAAGLTPEQMDALLKQDIEKRFVQPVVKALQSRKFKDKPILLTQNQFDMLVDIWYAGHSDAAKTAILDTLALGNGEKVAQLLLTDPPFNNKLGGLHRRALLRGFWWNNLPQGFNYPDTANVNVNDVIEFRGTDYAHWIGLLPQMRTSMLLMAKDFKAATSSKFIVSSAYRSQEEQTNLYNLWVANGGSASNPTVNVPGHGRLTIPSKSASKHGQGVACDCNTAQLDKAQSLGLLAQYNLSRPLPNDPVHIQYVGPGRPSE